MNRIALALLFTFAACGSGPKRPIVEKGANAVLAPRRSGAPERPDGPDPAALNVKFASFALAAGAASSVELDVSNRGQKPTGPFRIAVYISPGRVVTANRTLAGSVDLGNVEAGRAEHVVVAFRAPSSPGSYAIALEIDDARQVADEDRANNKAGSFQLSVR